MQINLSDMEMILQPFRYYSSCFLACTLKIITFVSHIQKYFGYICTWYAIKLTNYRTRVSKLS